MKTHFCSYLVICHLFLAGSVRALNVFTQNSNKEQTNIILNNQIQGSWDYKPSNGHTCRPAPTVIEKAQVNQRFFTIENSEDHDIQASFTVKKYDTQLMDVQITQQFTLIKAGEQKQILVYYNCKYPNNDDKETWGRVEFNVQTQNVNEAQPIFYSISLLKICEMPPNKYDYSIFILMAASVFMVAIGAYQIESPIVVEDQEQTQEVSKRHAIFFILGGSFFLVVMFFLYEYIQLIVTIMILLSAYSAISLLCNEILEKFAEQKQIHNHEFELPLLGKLNVSYCISAVVAISVVLTYAFTKNWVLSNFIAFSIVMLMFKVIRLPSYMVALILLGLAFIYDIFWVFYSDKIFGTSVMANVATKVELPMMFYCPKINPSPIQSCSLIGLGDIVLPGIFVSFCLNFSKRMHSNNQYYITCLGGYILGIAICVICLTVYQSAQPALLYLSPCTLIPVAIHALIKKEFSFIWSGIENISSDQINLNQNQKEQFEQLELGNDDQQKHKQF
ncbi:hypothetical protein ABPG72_001812 [Tetrahymena utriculariae]